MNFLNLLSVLILAAFLLMLAALYGRAAAWEAVPRAGYSYEVEAGLPAAEVLNDDLRRMALRDLWGGPEVLWQMAVHPGWEGWRHVAPIVDGYLFGPLKAPEAQAQLEQVWKRFVTDRGRIAIPYTRRQWRVA